MHAAGPLYAALVVDRILEAQVPACLVGLEADGSLSGVGVIEPEEATKRFEGREAHDRRLGRCRRSAARSSTPRAGWVICRDSERGSRDPATHRKERRLP
jgi:hypothetical protein